MDIYMTEKATGYGLALCMLPEEIKVSHSASFQSYDIINLGEVKIPKGTKLNNFNWPGTLPGPGRRGSFLKHHHWKEPKAIYRIWEDWKEKGTEIRLMVTETPINNDVYLSSFDAMPTGGHGDYDYTITFTQDRPLRVYTVGELGMNTATNQSSSRPPADSEAGSGQTYTVKSGDSLWKIAERLLGSGSRWSEIYDLNKDKIKDPDLIYPGQTFTLPAA